MDLVIYNTLTRSKERFKSLEEGKVKLYVCGPTVYDLLHIGNFRGVVLFNMVRNWLEHLGYSVTYVLNITDVDDKIIKRANEENISTETLTETYIEEYMKDLDQLTIPKHDINPRCTHHIDDMITFINTLIDQENAYCIEGSVFFRIHTFKDYGKLSGKNIDDLNAGHRVDPDPRKESPLDFILWKPAKPNEPSWDSPWGKGRPGWHIECSAMNYAHHGEQIDIHGGGIDLIFPHHENEIAQTEALTKKPFSTYWMHNNFIRFNDEKMSKSLGNVIKARDYMTRYHPEVLKFLLLSVHYRSELNIDTQQTYQSISRLSRIYSALSEAASLSARMKDASQTLPSSFKDSIEHLKKTVASGLNDDFNTPIAFAAIFDLVREFNREVSQRKKKDPVLHAIAHEFSQTIRDTGRYFSLFQETATSFLATLNTILIQELNLNTSEIETLISQRNDARKQKLFDKADTIREQLLAMHVLIQDTPEGTTWEVNKHSIVETQ